MFYLVSPLDSANATEVELTEEQEALLAWLQKNDVQHVRASIEAGSGIGEPGPAAGLATTVADAPTSIVDAPPNETGHPHRDSPDADGRCILADRSHSHFWSEAAGATIVAGAGHVTGTMTHRVTGTWRKPDVAWSP